MEAASKTSLVRIRLMRNLHIGTVFTVGDANFEGAGFLSEDQQTVEAVTVNSSGYFNNLTLIRVGGARAKGAGNANV